MLTDGKQNTCQQKWVGGKGGIGQNRGKAGTKIKRGGVVPNMQNLHQTLSPPIAAGMSPLISLVLHQLKC